MMLQNLLSVQKENCEIIRDSSVRKYEVEIKFVDGSISDVADKIIVDMYSELKSTITDFIIY